MSQNIRILDRFEYFTEDLYCHDCLYYKNMSERVNKLTGCGEPVCRFDDIRQDAIRNNRIRRKPGHFKVCDENPGSI